MYVRKNQSRVWAMRQAGGWSPILRQGDVQFTVGSQLVEKASDASLSPDEAGGYFGTSARAFANHSSITTGAVIGDCCHLHGPGLISVSKWESTKE
jgi:hypothetical protein